MLLFRFVECYRQIRGKVILCSTGSDYISWSFTAAATYFAGLLKRTSFFYLLQNGEQLQRLDLFDWPMNGKISLSMQLSTSFA